MTTTNNNAAAAADLKTAYIGSVAGAPKKGTPYRHLLLGGVPQHASEPFASREDAQAWVETVRRGNLKAGRLIDEDATGVSTVLLPPGAKLIPASEPAQPAACHCGQCGPVPAGAKRTPCTGARMAGPETVRVGTLAHARLIVRQPDTPDAARKTASAIGEFLGCVGKGDDAGLVEAISILCGRYVRKSAALALAALLPLLAASPAHAAKAPKAPRHGKPVAGCVRQPSGKWARLTPGGKWSTVACEAEITLRITDRANGARDGYELRYVSPEKCTVWVAEKRASDPNVIGAAYDACIDTMAAKAGV